MNFLRDKTIIFSVIVIVIAGYWLINDQDNLAVKTDVASVSIEKINNNESDSTAIVAKDIEVVGKKINSVLAKNDLWQTLSSYEIRANTFVNRGNSKEVKEFSELLAMELLQCLDNNFCGMEKDSEDDPYFDPTGTTAHKLIERSLGFINQAIEVDPNLRKELDYDLLQKLSEIPSEKIQSLVSENLNGSQDEVRKVQSSLMKTTSGKARLDALLSLKKSSPEERILFIDALKTTFNEGDAYTVVSVVENLARLKLSDDELAGSIVYLCRFKTDNFEHNWKAIKGNVEKVYPDFNKLCNY